MNVPGYQPYWKGRGGKKKRHRAKGTWETVLAQAVGAQQSFGRANVSAKSKYRVTH